jgi:hypothetical protein
MKFLQILLVVFTLSVIAYGQKSVSELKPTHAAALEQFLSKNKSYGFMSEKALSGSYLKFMRETFGKAFKPYYKEADFNHDKILDFALILSRKGQPTINEGVTSEEHKYNYPLAIVIFNANKNRIFTKAFIEDVEVPKACFLNVDTGRSKKKELYFGVFESDADTMIFTPAGKGYVIEYPDEP